MQKLMKGKLANRSKLIVCKLLRLDKLKTGATLREHCQVVLGIQNDWASDLG